MAAIDDAINSLSPEELDLLNSDPKLLSDFKAKYSAPTAHSPLVENAIKDYPQAALNAVQPAMDVAFPDLGNMAGAAVSGIGNLISDPKGAVNNSLDQLKQAGSAAIEPYIHPIDYAQQHPVSQAINAGMLLAPAFAPEAGAEAVFGKDLTPMPESSGIIKKLVGLFQKGADPEEVSAAAKSTADMVQQAKKTFGDKLNEAKSGFIPTSVEDKAESIRNYKNVFGFDPKSPLNLPKELKPLNPGEETVLKSPGEGLPDLPVKAKGSMLADSPEALKQMGMTDEEIRSAKQPSFDIGVDLPAIEGEAAHPTKSTVSADTLSKLGYKVPGTDMPYTLDSHSTPEELITAIERFKKNVPYIDPIDRVKAASYLQDQMKKQGVDFGKEQDQTMGLLKTQHKDLANIIENADPDLQAAKSKMHEVFTHTDTLASNLKEPGQAEAFLRRIFNNPTGKNADYLNHLRQIESLTGKETVDDLFDKFKKQSGSFTYDELKHPVANIIRKELPKVGQTVKAGLQRSVSPALRGFRMFNTPEMQSYLDRLRNKERNKGAK